jgi:hypothetical protein
MLSKIFQTVVLTAFVAQTLSLTCWVSVDRKETFDSNNGISGCIKFKAPNGTIFYGVGNEALYQEMLSKPQQYLEPLFCKTDRCNGPNDTVEPTRIDGSKNPATGTPTPTPTPTATPSISIRSTSNVAQTTQTANPPPAQPTTSVAPAAPKSSDPAVLNSDAGDRLLSMNIFGLLPVLLTSLFFL